MHFDLGLIVELALTVLLAVTLVYCIVLERRLAAVRKGQEGLKSTIGELNGAIANAGASMRALKASASGAAETLDERLARARTIIVNLPGSPKGAVESLESIAHLLPHAVHVLHGARHD